MTSLGAAFSGLINRTVFFYDIGGGQLGFLQLDCTVKENHERVASISQNEIEDGANVADNVVLQNQKFSLEGIISEAPFTSRDLRDVALRVQNAGFGALESALGSVGGGVLSGTAASLKRVVALIQLERFWENAIPFTVLTGLKRYDNVLIKSLSIPVTSRDGKSLRFNVECEQVRIVQSQSIFVPENTSTTGAATNQSLGKQATKAATDAESSKGSILFNLYKKVGG